MAIDKLPFSDKEQIKTLIPQREPIIMVDKLLSYSETEVTASFTITAENIFTANKTFSETGIVEHMAQTIALHSGYKNREKKGDASIGFIGAIKKVEVFKLPKVLDTLTTTATIVTEFMGITLVRLRCMSNDTLIAECEMKTAVANA
jgi:predicted hotdog family 3-hydroxylacyl-ACP dehydratase